MKGKTILWIIGGAIVAGAAVYEICKYLRHQEEEKPTDIPASHPGPATAPDVVNNTVQHGVVMTEPELIQQDAVSSIKDRHQAATQQLGETLDEMCEDSAAFEEKITQINDDLDQLLK